MKEELKSRQQEKSYHTLFTQIANHCVATGIDVKMAMEKIDCHEVVITPEFVKQTWRAILKAQTGKESTKDQTKEDIKGVQPVFAELWREITGERIDWPSVESKEFESYYNNH